jgi:hypothetical protein
MLMLHMRVCPHACLQVEEYARRQGKRLAGYYHAPLAWLPGADGPVRTVQPLLNTQTV